MRRTLLSALVAATIIAVGLATPPSATGASATGTSAGWTPVVPAPISAVGGPADVAAVLAAHDDFFRAYLTADAALAEHILSQDFVFTGNDGKALARAPYLPMLLDEVASRQLRDFRMDKVHVQVAGDAAIVSGDLSYTLVRDGVRVPSGGRFVDIYRREAAGWKVVTSTFFRADPPPAAG